MPWLKLLINVVTLGIPKIIEAIAKARREKREQEARYPSLKVNKK